MKAAKYALAYREAFIVLASTLRNDPTNKMGINYRGFASRKAPESLWHLTKALVMTATSPLLAMWVWTRPAFREYRDSP